MKPAVDGAGSKKNVLSAVEILLSETVASGRYLVVGGGAVGLETAEALSEAGAAATVIEMTDKIGTGLHATRLQPMLERLARSGVRTLKRTKLLAIEDQWAQVESEEKQTRLGPFDYFVFAVGSRSNRQLADTVAVDVPVTVIGDAVQPRTIYEAVREGFQAALQLR